MTAAREAFIRADQRYLYALIRALGHSGAWAVRRGIEDAPANLAHLQAASARAERYADGAGQRAAA